MIGHDLTTIEGIVYTPVNDLRDTASSEAVDLVANRLPESVKPL